MIYIESIIYCAIDSYEFITPPDDYLGHWSKDDFEFNIVSKKSINNLNAKRTPTTGELRGSFNPNNLLYPVFNSPYKAYRKKYKKERDIVVWTKPEVISMEDMSNEFKTIIVKKSDINSSL